MAKSTSLKLVSAISQELPLQPVKSEILQSVKRNIEVAVSQLRSLGSKYEKAAWMLEDSLTYALSDPEQPYSAQDVDWASLTQAEELFEGRR